MRTYLQLSLIAAVSALLTLLALGKTTLAATLFWSYWGSESSIGYWIGIGINPSVAILIGIALGNFSLSNFWAIAHSEWRSPWLIKIGNLFRKFTDRSTDLDHWRNRHPRIFVMFTGFIPGIFWIGIVFAKSRVFNPWKTLGLLIIGNTAKNITAGLLFLGAEQFEIVQHNMKYVAMAVWLIMISKEILMTYLHGRRHDRLTITATVTAIAQPEQTVPGDTSAELAQLKK